MTTENRISFPFESNEAHSLAMAPYTHTASVSQTLTQLYFINIHLNSRTQRHIRQKSTEFGINVETFSWMTENTSRFSHKSVLVTLAAK